MDTKCLTIIILVHLSGSYSQEPSEMFGISSICSDRNGNPQMCYPPFTSAIADRKVSATNTCGEKSRQKYCIHMSSAGMSSRCQYCDARNPFESHFPEFMTDKNPNNWWQSETMADNPYLHFKESVNLTVDLGTQFHVNYVYLQFRSPRPHAMVIYKRYDDQSDWTPWAYFSSNCYTYFGMTYSPVPEYTRPDDVICQEEYSTLQPLYGGEMIFSVINGRPNYDRFFEDKEIQRWSTAKQIRIELKKMYTFGDERGAEKDTLLTYYFAIQKFTVGGRCLCHGHGNECRPSSGPGQPDRLVCVCAPNHHTTGDNCEQCEPDHRDAPWQPATPESANPCRPCKCNGNTRICEFDQELYDLTGSGSRCIACGNNTEGNNCERCKTGYFPDPVYPTVCKPCSCDPIGTLDGQHECAVTGQCKCKPGIGGHRCDRCLEGYYGFSGAGCQSCGCNVIGSFENRGDCDPVTGQCMCKQNVGGRQCEKCKLGHYGLMSNDPLGCKPCNCSLHSSECELDTQALAIAAGKPGESVQLVSLVDPEKVIISCPPGKEPCDVCLQKDREHIQVDCNGTSEGFIPCLCESDPNLCQYCPAGRRTPQKDPRSEICKCPAPYVGNSCESCAVGFRRDPPGGEFSDRCVACTCNNHSTVCHPESGQCECQDNTAGLFCDRCADGYYGDALAPVGSPEACKPCPCPNGAKCEEVHWPGRMPEVMCFDCPDNRAGTRCERCSENFYGDPTKGIPCQPCDCSDNVDPREFGNCDGLTGECLKCLFGTTGEHCEKCLPGYRRNMKPSNISDTALVPARGCSPCHCEPMGTLASYGPQGIGICNPDDGQCPCKPGVGGLRCEECNPGFYGYHTGQGCKPCDCDSIGAMGESCHDQTGRCQCRPNVHGRQCDQCLPGFFNLTSTHGCQDCACHAFGSLDRQCDEKGQCKCKPFATGLKCDKCEENHYNLEAGCLPCPPCYTLIQARVSKLWAMLESVFGPLKPDQQPGTIPSPDDEDLQTELRKLNDTIVGIYRAVLEIGGKPSVVNVEQLTKTIETLARQVEQVQMDMEKIKQQPPKCSVTEANKQLDQVLEDIEENLPKRLDGEVQEMLKQLMKAADQYEGNPTLTKEANDVAALADRLRNQSTELQQSAEEVTRLTSDAMKKIDQSEAAIKESKGLLATTKYKSDAIEKKNDQIKQQIDTISEHLQQASNQVYHVRTGTDQLPDLSKEVRMLQTVMSQWEKAKNTSEALEKQLNKSSEEVQTTIDRLRQINTQLRNSLSDRHLSVKKLEPQLAQIQQLTGRVERAQNTSWKALQDAKEKYEQLKDFESHVASTKQLVSQALSNVDSLQERLKVVESSVKDVQYQAKQELDAAYQLSNRTAELKKMWSELQESIKKELDRVEVNKASLGNMRSRHDLEVVYGVNQASKAVEGVKEETKDVFGTVSTTQQRVKEMNQDVENMLRRMVRLKEQLTHSTSGGTGLPINGEDATRRFAKLQAQLNELNIPKRLAHLRQLNHSRTIEINYLQSELTEFEAHEKHLSELKAWIPSNTSICFYSGKEIEGDIPIRLQL